MELGEGDDSWGVFNTKTTETEKKDMENVRKTQNADKTPRPKDKERELQVTNSEILFFLR